MTAEEITKRPTIIDLARAAGVSKSTVSLVLNDSPLVKEDKRRRVEEAIRTFGYVYNRNAARLRAPANDVVGMVINDLSNPFFAEMALGIEAEAGRRKVSPFLANTGECVKRQFEVARAMFERGAAGFIISPAIGTAPHDIEEIAAFGVPVVLAMRRLTVNGISAVTPDNAGGAAAAVAHLASLGHRRIGFLGGVAGMVVRDDRLSGFRRGLAEAGLEGGDTVEIECPITREGGAEAMSRLLEVVPDATAILTFNDLVAIGAMHALEHKGIRPGEDFAVVGFDDVAEARWARPQLTTVSIDAAGLGALATRILFEMTEGAAPRGVEGPAELVVRQSCGAARQVG